MTVFLYQQSIFDNDMASCSTTCSIFANDDTAAHRRPSVVSLRNLGTCTFYEQQTDRQTIILQENDEKQKWSGTSVVVMWFFLFLYEHPQSPFWLLCYFYTFGYSTTILLLG